MATSIQSTRPIAEDSLFCQAIACIPVIGVVPSFLANLALQTEIVNALGSTPKVITLLEVKNKFKVATIVRCVLTIALLISAIVFKVFAYNFVVILICTLHLLTAGKHVYEINQNQKVIQELETRGITGSFKFY